MSRVEVVFPRHLVLPQNFPVVFVSLFEVSHLEVAPGDGAPRRHHPFPLVFQFVETPDGLSVPSELHQAQSGFRNQAGIAGIHPSQARQAVELLLVASQRGIAQAHLFQRPFVVRVQQVGLLIIVDGLVRPAGVLVAEGHFLQRFRIGRLVSEHLLHVVDGILVAFPLHEERCRPAQVGRCLQHLFQHGIAREQLVSPKRVVELRLGRMKFEETVQVLHIVAINGADIPVFLVRVPGDFVAVPYLCADL